MTKYFYKACLLAALLTISQTSEATAETEFSKQAKDEATERRADCESLKLRLEPLLAKERFKNRKVLKQTSDIEKAISIIDAFDLSTEKRNELRDKFFKLSNPTTTDIEGYLALDSANCAFHVFGAIDRTIETAGNSTDPVQKDNAASLLNRWFLNVEKNHEGLVNAGVAPLLFDTALRTKLLKADAKDLATLEEIKKSTRKKTGELVSGLKTAAIGQVASDPIAATKMTEKELEAKIDPLKMQKALAEERLEIQKMNSQLKQLTAKFKR